MLHEAAVAAGEEDGLGRQPRAVMVDALLKVVEAVDELAVLLGAVVAAADPVEALAPREGVLEGAAVQLTPALTGTPRGGGDRADQGSRPGNRCGGHGG